MKSNIATYVTAAAISLAALGCNEPSDVVRPDTFRGLANSQGEVVRAEYRIFKDSTNTVERVVVRNIEAHLGQLPYVIVELTGAPAAALADSVYSAAQSSVFSVEAK